MDRAASIEELHRKFPSLAISVIGDVLENAGSREAAENLLAQLDPSPSKVDAAPKSAVPRVSPEDAEKVATLKQLSGLSDTIVLGALLQQGGSLQNTADCLLNIAEDREAIEQLKEMTRDQVLEYQRKLQEEHQKRELENQKKREQELQAKAMQLAELERQRLEDERRLKEEKERLERAQKEAEQERLAKLRAEEERLRLLEKEAMEERQKREALEKIRNLEAQELERRRLEEHQLLIELERFGRQQKEIEDRAKQLEEEKKQLEEKLKQFEKERQQAANYTLKLEYSTAQQTANIYWQMSSATAYDWIGLYKFHEQSNKNYIQAYKTKGESKGIMAVPTPSSPGVYQYRLFLNGSYEDVARTEAMYIGARLELFSSFIEDGKKIRLTWVIKSGVLNKNDWIGFYRSDKRGNNYETYFYPIRYPNNEFIIDTPRRGGYHYEFRFVPYGSGDPIYKSEPLLVPSKDKVECTELFDLNHNLTELRVTWEVHSFDPSSWDWIGLYKVGARNNYYEEYKYVDKSTKYLVFKAPRTPGQYEFRLHSGHQASSRSLATSKPFTVIDRDRLSAAYNAGFIRVEWEIYSVDVSSSDWIGLFKETEPSNGKSVDYKWVDPKSNFYVFVKPKEPGVYNVRYFSAARPKYEPLKISEPIVIE